MRRLTVVTAALVPLMKQMDKANVKTIAATLLPVDLRIISVIGMPVEVPRMAVTSSKENKTARRNITPLMPLVPSQLLQ